MPLAAKLRRHLPRPRPWPPGQARFVHGQAKPAKAHHSAVVAERREWSPRDVFSTSVVGRRRANEDRALALVTDADQAAAAVLDGHGGSAVVDFAAERLEQLLRDTAAARASAAQLLAALDAAVCGELGAAARRSGATATLALVSRTEIAVAWLGDSDAVLCRRGYCGSFGAEDQVVTKLLTDTHDPGRADEQDRIKALGGVIKEVRAFGRKFRPAGELRVWSADGSASLPITRSLGDLAMRPWVSPEPEMVRWSRRTGDDLFVLVASDGVWDVLSPAYACRVAISACSGRPVDRDAWSSASEAIEADTWDAEAAARGVVKEAMYWGSVDNVSVAIISLVE